MDGREGFSEDFSTFLSLSASFLAFSLIRFERLERLIDNDNSAPKSFSLRRHTFPSTSTANVALMKFASIGILSVAECNQPRAREKILGIAVW